MECQKCGRKAVYMDSDGAMCKHCLINESIKEVKNKKLYELCKDLQDLSDKNRNGDFESDYGRGLQDGCALAYKLSAKWLRNILSE